MNINYRNDDEISPNSEIKDNELFALLEKLHDEKLAPNFDIEPKITVSSIVEVTEHTLEEVAEALNELRRERYSKVIQELEAPLHRVERPSPKNSDPMNNAFSRLSQKNALLDSLPKPQLIVMNKKQRSKEELDHDLASQKISARVLFFMLLILALAVIIPLLNR